VTDIVAVVGPTASGKTGLAMELAERLDTEIISADSMQFYRGMTIGTAAPTPEQQDRVKHHFIQFLDPGEHFSAGAYERAARRVAAHIHNRGKIPVAVGGSGLYIRALVDGLFPGPCKNDPIRERLNTYAAEHGVEALYSRLQEVDPEYADSINPNDLRRIVRALEVFEIAQRPLSQLHREHRKNAAALDALQVTIDWPRQELYARIDARVDRMLEQGLLEEVKNLIGNGHAEHIERLRTLGYREMAAYLRGESTFEEAAELMKRNTRRFAKRQLTWFRADPRIRWLQASIGPTAASFAEKVLAFLAA